MLKKLLVIMLVLALVGIFSLSVGGCGDKEEGPASMEDYREQAKQEIDDANLDEELDKIQKEIDADKE